jgi:XrtJ-associated TM-motif-TM protein
MGIEPAFAVYSRVIRARPGYEADRFQHADDEMREVAMNRRCRILLGLMLAAGALPLHAQGGCTDSPEAPTIVLALVGGAGALAASIKAAVSRKRQG